MDQTFLAIAPYRPLLYQVRIEMKQTNFLTTDFSYYFSPKTENRKRYYKGSRTQLVQDQITRPMPILGILVIRRGFLVGDEGTMVPQKRPALPGLYFFLKEIHRKKTPKSPPTISGQIPDDQMMAAVPCDPMAFVSLSDDKRREVLFRLIPGMNPTKEDIVLYMAKELYPKVQADQEDLKSLDDLNYIKQIMANGVAYLEDGWFLHEDSAGRMRERARRMTVGS